MWLPFIHPSAAIVSVRHCSCSAQAMAGSIKTCGHYSILPQPFNQACKVLSPLLPTRTLFSFQVGRAVASIAKGLAGCFFPFLFCTYSCLLHRHFAPVLDFYVSYKHPSCAIITIPVSIHMIRTHSFHSAFLLWLLLCLFFFFSISASLAFVVLLSPPLRFCAGSPGGRAEREGTASVLMGDHGQRIIH
ncbi:hypothetical protein DFS33DRAFT_467353 [Desarmillaria ectypa]|nr:hypothetical protein DFS33DRAFT_467353 [Desarmillaria ectypa]